MILRAFELTQRVHVGTWYILRAQRGSHIPTLRPKYTPYSYMDPLGYKLECDLKLRVLVCNFVGLYRLKGFKALGLSSLTGFRLAGAGIRESLAGQSLTKDRTHIRQCVPLLPVIMV